MQDSTMPAGANRAAGFFVIRAGAMSILHSWCGRCRAWNDPDSGCPCGRPATAVLVEL